jgi:hypothetical protein
MLRGLRTVSVLACCLVAPSCASSGAPKRPHVNPPEMLGRTRPDLVPVAVTPNAARPTSVVQLQVVVNADGTPDMSTLKLTGPGAESNRASLTSWVQSARFKAATQDGVPVSAMYTTSFSLSVRAVRVVSP